MADMLVKLFDITLDEHIEKSLLNKDIAIKRALAPDRSKIIEFANTCAN